MRKLTVIVLFCLFASAAFADTEKTVEGALDQIGKTLIYDGSYVKLTYPGGDIPIQRGVCTDVVIRALRNAEVDLQVKIHEDMKNAFSSYPNNWGLTRPDSNIDHRRVPNIVTYYKRQKRNLPLPVKVENVLPGDLIAWMLPNNRPHIGVVSRIHNNKAYIVHNIGWGARENECLYDWTITAHIRPFDK